MLQKMQVEIKYFFELLLTQTLSLIQTFRLFTVRLVENQMI